MIVLARWIVLTLTAFSSLGFAAKMHLQHGSLGSGIIEVDFKFDGTNQRMHLDTGANSSVLARADWNASYPAIGQSERQGASGKVYQCDAIQFGEVSLNSIQHRLFKTDRCAQGSTLLGMDFWKGHVLTLDFYNEKILVDQSATVNQPFRRLDHDYIGLPIALQERNYYGLFDTGAQLTSVDQQFVDQNPSLFASAGPVNVKDSSGQKVSAAKLYKLKSIKIGSFEIKDIYVIAFDFKAIGIDWGTDVPVILGFNIISKMNWVLDLKNDLWSAQPF